MGNGVLLDNHKLPGMKLHSKIAMAQITDDGAALMQLFENDREIAACGKMQN